MAATRYSQFKSRVRYYLAALGLGDWRVDFSHRVFQGDTNTIAAVQMQLGQKAALFTLNKGCKPAGDKRHDLEDTALHEVLRLAFYELLRAAAATHSDQSPRVEALEHALINRLGAWVLGRQK
jgi:hypothetical protein